MLKEILRPRSLRLRALGVALLIGLAPLPFVWLSERANASQVAHMRSQVDAAADSGSQVLNGAATPSWQALDGLARQHRVRIRIMNESQLLFQSGAYDLDTSIGHRLGGLFFGSQGSPTLDSYDEVAPPPWLRPEVAAVRKHGSAASCDVRSVGKSSLPLLLVCFAGRRIERPGVAPYVLLAEQSQRRTIRVLYDVRYQLLRVTLYVLLIGGLLGWFFGWRLVRPLRLLRDQVLSGVTRRNEEELILLKRNDEIGDLARAFNTLLRSRAERSRAHEVFVSDLVHEMKNPVAAIGVCADAMDAKAALHPERLQRMARVLRQSSQRLDELISRFLDLARAEAGLLNEERRPIDLALLIEDLIELLRGNESDHGIRFLTELHPAPIFGVPRRLESALLNLLENATFFAGKNGWIAVHVEVIQGMAVVQVKDSGPGIAATDLPRIFDRFFTTRSGACGTGLGLPLARAIVEAHGGTLTAASPPGEGATLRMQIPVAAYHPS